MGTIKEIIYLDKPDQANTDEMVKFAKKRMDDLGIRNAVIVYSSGYTMTKFREVIKGEKGLNVIKPVISLPNILINSLRKWRRPERLPLLRK